MYDYRFPDAAFTAWVVVSQTWSAMYRVAERRLAKVGLTPEQTDLLWICKDYHGPLTPAEISRLLFRKSQTIAGLLTRMERDGLVRRVPKRKGHPFTEIQITAKGEERIGPAREVATSFIAKIMSSLSEEELEQFQTLLRKIRHNVLEDLHLELMTPPGNASRELTDINR